MPRNIGYPEKTRNIAVGKPYPPRTRSVGDMKVHDDLPKPTQHGVARSGKPPAKGVLKSGGGHG